MSDAIIGGEDLREIRLYGYLGKQFGKSHFLAVKTCREAAQAMRALFPGFGQAVIDHDPGFHVFAGKRTKSNNLAEDVLDAPLGKGETVFIVPAISGSKRGGFLQIVVGAVLIVAGIYFQNPNLVSVGVAMALGGVIQMITPVRKESKNESDKNNPSYHFDGPINVAEQGGPVPVIYGRMIVGSVVGSQALSSVDIANGLPAPTGLAAILADFMKKKVYSA